MIRNRNVSNVCNLRFNEPQPERLERHDHNYDHFCFYITYSDNGILQNSSTKRNRRNSRVTTINIAN